MPRATPTGVSIGQDGYVSTAHAADGGTATDPAHPVPAQPVEPAATAYRRMRRLPDDRILAGVCSGIAEHLGVPTRPVRWAVAGLVLTGVGVPAYLFLWALVPQQLGAPDASSRPQERPRTLRSALSTTQPDLRLGAVLVGALVVIAVIANLAGAGGSWLGVVLPLVAIVVGAGVAWRQLDESERERWSETGAGPRWWGVGRLVAGLALTSAGVLTLATRDQGWSGVVSATVAAIAMLIGVAVVALPWGIRFWQRFKQEQAARVRATERADIAAHLHDSVLQTLALIQRSSGNPGEVARLARSQERELRSWLYGGPEDEAHSLAAAVRAAAAEVEERHGIPVDVAVSGDAPHNETTTALVQAAREAMLNAVRHGAAPVSVFVEVGPQRIEVFVRDHGPGFDIEAVAADRLGVRESIIGRMTRHGGTAVVRRREPGTEVCLSVPWTSVPEPDSVAHEGVSS